MTTYMPSTVSTLKDKNTHTHLACCKSYTNRAKKRCVNRKQIRHSACLDYEMFSVVSCRMISQVSGYCQLLEAAGRDREPVSEHVIMQMGFCQEFVP